MLARHIARQPIQIVQRCHRTDDDAVQPPAWAIEGRDVPTMAVAPRGQLGEDGGFRRKLTPAHVSFTLVMGAPWSGGHQRRFGRELLVLCPRGLGRAAFFFEAASACALAFAKIGAVVL